MSSFQGHVTTFKLGTDMLLTKWAWCNRSKIHFTVQTFQGEVVVYLDLLHRNADHNPKTLTNYAPSYSCSIQKVVQRVQTRHCALLCQILPVHLVALAMLGLHGALDLELRKRFNEKIQQSFSLLPWSFQYRIEDVRNLCTAKTTIGKCCYELELYRAYVVIRNYNELANILL